MSNEDIDKMCAQIPESYTQAMLEYYGLADNPESTETQMRDNGVSWSDFI